MAKRIRGSGAKNKSDRKSTSASFIETVSVTKNKGKRNKRNRKTKRTNGTRKKNKK